MSSPTTTIPTEPPPEMLRLLREAVAELRHYPNDVIMSSRFERAHDVADYLEYLTDRLIAGDIAAGRDIHFAFLATGDWDDAGGSHELGNLLVVATSPYWPSEH